MSTVLLTGATGFLGGALARRLAGKRSLILLKRESTPIPSWAKNNSALRWLNIEGLSWKKAFEDPLEAIIHTATDYGRAPGSLERVIQANLTFPLTLMKETIDRGVGCFINTDTTLAPLVNPYSLSKNQFADWLRLFSPPLKTANIALEMLYGPGDKNNNLITHTLTSFLDGEKVLQFTPGEQIRDFIYLDDAVEAFVAVLDALTGLPAGFHEFPLGTGRSVSIRQFVETAKSAAGAETRLNFGALAYRSNEIMHSTADIHALEELGWRPRVPLEEGLRLTIEYLREKSAGAKRTEHGQTG